MTSNQPSTGRPRRDAAYFDQWYGDMATSRVRDAIFATMLGLPAELLSTSMLSWHGIAEVVSALRLTNEDTLLDLACGRGGYGIEVAHRTGSHLIGVDFSAVALEQARRSADRALPPGGHDFYGGSLTDTGLPDAAVDAVMCVDAIQFADPPLAGLAELRRVLAPGGRVVLTTWEAADSADDRVSDRIRAVNLKRDLPAAGFVDVDVRERPDWRALERAFWDEALAAPEDIDEAVASLQAEGRRSVAAWDSLTRVLATAAAPQVEGG